MGSGLGYPDVGETVPTSQVAHRDPSQPLTHMDRNSSNLQLGKPRFSER